MTGNGKFKRAKAGKQHCNYLATKNRLRRLKFPAYAEKMQRKKLKVLMPYA